MSATLLFSGKANVTREDIIMVRQEEPRRLHVIHKVIEGTLTRKEAADLVSSERRVRRIVSRTREERETGVCHKPRGRYSPRKSPFKQRIVELHREHCANFGPPSKVSPKSVNTSP
jgi:transposase